MIPRIPHPTSSQRGKYGIDNNLDDLVDQVEDYTKEYVETIATTVKNPRRAYSVGKTVATKWSKPREDTSSEGHLTQCMHVE